MQNSEKKAEKPLKVKDNQTIEANYNLTIFDYYSILQSPNRERERKKPSPESGRRKPGTITMNRPMGRSDPKPQGHKKWRFDL